MALAKLGGGATLLGGGLAAEPVRVGRETSTFVPQAQEPLPRGETQAEKDAAQAVRLFQPVAVELLTDGADSPGDEGAAGAAAAAAASADSPGDTGGGGPGGGSADF